MQNKYHKQNINFLLAVCACYTSTGIGHIVYILYICTFNKLVPNQVRLDLQNYNDTEALRLDLYNHADMVSNPVRLVLQKSH